MGQDQTDNNQSLAQADKFMDSGKKFEKAWHKFDNSKQQIGMLDLMEAHAFIKNVIPHAEAHSATDELEEKAAEDYIAKTLF